MQDNIKAISSVYESFLSLFPLCHGYWKKYADHQARLCTMEKAVEIFEQAVQSATYSVGLWVDYCSFSILAFADPSDIRRIFERGLSFVGKDFLCHRLWDLYIRFELSQQQWSSLAHILIRSLKFPTKSLHKYYDNFREFAAFVEEDMSCPKSCNLEPHAADSNVEVARSDDEIIAIKELQNSSSIELRSKALYKFITIGERFYSKACQLHEKIDYFENYMERDFFHVKPLEDEELENWHNYLDFIEKQEDFDWAVKLYERCLIPCANYPEFWMRYVEFIESKGGREIANFALERATQVFLKDPENVSEVHIFNARFREKIGDIEGARAALLRGENGSDSSFIETAIREANMEKRLGNLDTALDIYDKALKMAADKEKMHIIPILYIQLFRLKYLITGSEDAAVDLLIAGIQQVPHSRLLLEELINFAMLHEGSRHLNVVDPIMATAITCGSDGSQGLSSKDREDLSHLYLKFVDYCGTTHDIGKAWNRHIKSFPHLIRSSSSHKSPSNQLLNEPEEVRERIPRLVAKQPIVVNSIEHIPRVSAEENHKLSISKNQAIKPHEATANQHGGNDEDNAAGEFKSLKRHSRNDASEMIESSLALHKRGEIESVYIDSIDHIQSQKDTLGPNEPQVSHKYDQIRHKPEKEHEVEMLLIPVSLESLSLLTREKGPNVLEDTVPSVNNENPSTSTRNPFSATESAKKQNGTEEHGSESLSFSPGHRNLREQTDPQQYSSQNPETCCKTNHMLTASEDASAESDGQPRQHHRQPHQGFPLIHESTANQDHPNPTKENIENNTWPVANVQPQSSSSAPQPVQPHPNLASMGHATMLPHPTTTPAGFETPYTQQNSENRVAQPTGASGSAPTNIGSPSNCQPSSHRASSVPSKSLHSPSLEQTLQSG
ncbi:RNA-processing protein, HAT helix [Cynara cardunculus var. scolymus]|uniref:RNA-processing protein, HAT helix n=1 Tax=Cynara cardunculus var. scolymus TaxID=59895 RepID=A0A103XAB6_CYNCS|nr:RNA-processing protein, HAT helix [Cynara cardunculus var. scolymus]